MTCQPTICFLPPHMTGWQEMVELAKILNIEIKARQVFIDLGNFSDRYCASLRGLNIEIIPFSLGPSQEPNKAKTFLIKSLHKLGFGRTELNMLVKDKLAPLANLYQNAKDLLDKINPDMLVAYSGRTFHEVPFMKICQDRLIPVIIPPVAFAGGSDDLINRRRANDMLMVDRFPWVLDSISGQVIFDEHEQANFSFYPIPDTLAMKKLLFLPPKPWVLGGGWKAIIMADSNRTKYRLLGQGVDKENITVTGHLAHDELFKRYSQRDNLKYNIEHKYGLSAGKNLGLVALPQLYEHGNISWDQQLKEMDFLANHLQNTDSNFLLSLHPRMDPEQYNFLQEKYGLPIATEPLKNVLPAGDFLIASYSSTVMWAALFKMPVLVLSYFGVRHPVFDDYPRVTILTERDKLSHELNMLIKLNPDGQRGSIAAGESIDYSFSPFDGNCKQRIIDIIKRNINN
jgi:hypothetical protein